MPAGATAEYKGNQERGIAQPTDVPPLPAAATKATGQSGHILAFLRHACATAERAQARCSPVLPRGCYRSYAAAITSAEFLIG